MTLVQKSTSVVMMIGRFETRLESAQTKNKLRLIHSGDSWEKHCKAVKKTLKPRLLKKNESVDDKQTYFQVHNSVRSITFT